MPTTVTKTIKAAGGDYTSLAAWQAGQSGNIVTRDTIEIAECHDLGGADSTAVNLTGWTTDATHYIRITVPIADRHNGTRSSSKYRLIGDGVFSPMLNIAAGADYVRIEGLQIRNTSTHGTEAVVVDCSGAASDIRFTDILVYDSAADGINVNSSQNMTLNNCVLMHNVGSGLTGANRIVHAYNSVSIGNGGFGFNIGSFGEIIAKNSYAGGNTSADYHGGTLTLTTSPAEDGTGTSVVAYSTTSGAKFTNVTAGSEDIHLQAGSSLIDAGTDLSADAFWIEPGGSIDIDGDTRATWDIGADESTSTPTPPPTPTSLAVGTITSTNIALSWTQADPQPDGWTAQYDWHGNNFASPVSVDVPFGTTSINLGGLASVREYDFRVRAYLTDDATNHTDWAFNVGATQQYVSATTLAASSGGVVAAGRRRWRSLDGAGSMRTRSL